MTDNQIQDLINEFKDVDMDEDQLGDVVIGILWPHVKVSLGDNFRDRLWEDLVPVNARPLWHHLKKGLKND